MLTIPSPKAIQAFRSEDDRYDKSTAKMTINHRYGNIATLLDRERIKFGALVVMLIAMTDATS